MAASILTPEVREYIIDELSVGRSLREICREDGMPAESTVRKLAVHDDEFGAQYARAREAGMDALADEIIEIADETKWDVSVDSEGNERINGEVVQRSRLKVDTRKWIMSKLAHKKYGERIDLNHAGTIATASDATIDARLAFLLGKAGIGGASGGEGEEA